MTTIAHAAIRVHILGITLQSDVSEHRLLEELRRRGYRVQPSDLRLALDDIVKRGLIERHDTMRRCRNRRTYEATPAGRMAWADECRALSKFAHEVFGAQLPPLPAQVGLDDSQAWSSAPRRQNGETKTSRATGQRAF
jgi:DNA-binding PadR family transcriptional regulator